jgi:hypothetical protein
MSDIPVLGVDVEGLGFDFRVQGLGLGRTESCPVFADVADQVVPLLIPILQVIQLICRIVVL